MNIQRPTLNVQRSTLRIVCPLVVMCLYAIGVHADVSVTASVDRNHITFGESVTLTISVQGTQGGAAPSIPKVEGLTLNGPSTQTSMSIVNSQISQSINFVYQVTPGRTGNFTIPAIALNIDGRTYSTTPISLTVEKLAAVQNQQGQTLFAQVRVPSQQVYLGQTMPLQVVVFARTDVPLKSLGGFTSRGRL